MPTTKKYQRTIDKIIYPVSCKYGAPMGRTNVDKTKIVECNGELFSTLTGHLFDCRVPLDSGGYDKGGAYWGIGTELRVSYTKDLTYIIFYRK